MILRNEVHGIARTLASVRRHIDQWLIVDTGSADGTQDFVTKYLADIPGRLIEATFIDFSTARNHALSLAGEDADFVLMLSGDEELHGGEKLHQFCQDAPTKDAGGYYIPVRLNTVTYDSARLSRSGAGWRYRGRTHERLEHPVHVTPGVRVPGVFITHDKAPWPAPIARWQRDLEILEEDHQLDPKNARTVFYLAQTCQNLGLIDRAIALYGRRSYMLPDGEEVLWSLLRNADMMIEQDARDQRILPILERAVRIAPDRKEAVLRLATHLEDVVGMFESSLLYDEAAEKLPWPSRLGTVVEHDLYGKMPA